MSRKHALTSSDLRKPQWLVAILWSVPLWIWSNLGGFLSSQGLLERFEGTIFDLLIRLPVIPGVFVSLLVAGSINAISKLVAVVANIVIYYLIVLIIIGVVRHKQDKKKMSKL